MHSEKIRIACFTFPLDTLRDRFESMDAAPGAPERRIVIVELPKTAEHGIGLTIVGGENTGKCIMCIM